MKKFSFLFFVSLIAFCFGGPTRASVRELNNQDTQSQSAQTNSNQIVPRHLRRRHRRERRRRGIKYSYGRAGRSMGRGGAGFGKNIAKGKPIVAGRRLGRGAGGFGSGTGKGTAGVGKRVGTTTKRVFTGKPKPSPTP